MIIHTTFDTTNRSYQVKLEAKDEHDAVQKLQTVSKWLSRRSFSLQPFDASYLEYCIGGLENPAEEFQDIGTIFSVKDAMDLKAEISKKNSLLDNLKNKPVSSIAKGALTAPLIAPISTLTGISRDLTEIFTSLKRSIGYGMKIYKEASQQSITFDGVEYQTIAIEVSSSRKPSLHTLIVLLTATVALTSIFHPFVPTIAVAPLLLISAALYTNALRVIYFHLKGKTENER